MALFQIRLNPSQSELRWFAGLWFPALCGMAGWLIFDKAQAPIAAIAICGVGAAFSVFGLFSPAAIRPIYLLIMRLTYPIGWVMSHVVLAVLYFGVFTPLGIVLRLFHDPMRRQIDHSAKSYWIPRGQPERARYFRQT